MDQLQSEAPSRACSAWPLSADGLRFLPSTGPELVRQPPPHIRSLNLTHTQTRACSELQEAPETQTKKVQARLQESSDFTASQETVEKPYLAKMLPYRDQGLRAWGHSIKCFLPSDTCVLVDREVNCFVSDKEGVHLLILLQVQDQFSPLGHYPELSFEWMLKATTTTTC